VGRTKQITKIQEAASTRLYKLAEEQRNKLEQLRKEKEDK
jgi:hypothetical protein